MSESRGLRVVFAGTPVFAERALDRILASGHPVIGVLTQPDRPAGRGQKLAASAVKVRALAAGIPVQQPASLREPAAQAALRSLNPDVIVVAAFGLILPPAVLEIAPWGCLNIHASLLPRWRGAAPIVRAIQAGDSETGICIMRMEAGLDTGPVALTRCIPIHPNDSAGCLHDRLAELGAASIVDILDQMGGASTHTNVRFEPQPSTGVTYAHKIHRSDAAIDWGLEAGAVANHLRAFDPSPGAHSALLRQPEMSIRLFNPARVDGAVDGGVGAGAPGEVLAVSPDGLVVACGRGSIRVSELQRAGGRRLRVGEFVRGNVLAPGDRFAMPPRPAPEGIAHAA